MKLAASKIQSFEGMKNIFVWNFRVFVVLYSMSVLSRSKVQFPGLGLSSRK